MPELSVNLQVNDEEHRQLRAEAEKAGMSAPSLVERWVKERLLHEREKAHGISRHGNPVQEGNS